MLLNTVLKSIGRHRNSISKEVRESYKELHQNIEAMIQQLSQLKMKLQLEERHFGLTDQELNFMKLLESQEFDKINGKVTSELKKAFEVEYPFKIKSFKDIRQEFKSQRKEFSNLCEYIKCNYMKYEHEKMIHSIKETMVYQFSMS